VFAQDKAGYGKDVNMLKGGLVFADKISTVSQTYCDEIKTSEYGETMDPVINYHHLKLCGILNGIDYEVYDPATDQSLAVRYDASTALEAKRQNKLALQEELGLAQDEGKFVIGLISRLTDQKGLDLVNDIMERMLDEYTQFVLIGTGDWQYEDLFRNYENRHRGQVCSNIMYSDARARRLYAAADAILVPSRFEPCGLTQMMAFRYGALPIVRATGGLKDTVQAYNEFDGSGNGFSFSEYSSYALLNTINYAKRIYFTQRGRWNGLVESAMAIDHSWEQSATQYKNLYLSMTGPDDEPVVVEEPAPVVEAPAPVVEEPVAVEEAPAPVVEEPVAVEEAPAPVAEEPVVVEETPAPAVEEPAAVEETPAPVAEEPAAVEEAPAPAAEAKPAKKKAASTKKKAPAKKKSTKKK
jgi:ADP-glucose type glycogen/starch synthase